VSGSRHRRMVPPSDDGVSDYEGPKTVMPFEPDSPSETVPLAGATGVVSLATTAVGPHGRWKAMS
jgi:hypothetical protein